MLRAPRVICCGSQGSIFPTAFGKASSSEEELGSASEEDDDC